MVTEEVFELSTFLSAKCAAAIEETIHCIRKLLWANQSYYQLQDTPYDVYDA